MAPAIDARRRSAAQVHALAEAIGSQLAGLEPTVQSAVLADLLATFLAGWRGPDAGTTGLVRTQILEAHLTLVLGLLGVSAAAEVAEAAAAAAAKAALH